MKPVYVFAVAAAAAYALASCDNGSAAKNTPAVPVYKAGAYTGSAVSVGGELCVELTVSSVRITDVVVTKQNDNIDRPEVALALEQIPRRIVESQSAGVDAVSGATVTSNRIMDAARECVSKARLAYSYN
ncbi:MAG: FMN-binding protein [Treponema sp.]|jgi:uncharacterized protein with FMN-binding domain|nr:FMN-binding protein [Treponema sp.]